MPACSILGCWQAGPGSVMGNYYGNWGTVMEYATNYSTSLLMAAPLALGPIIEQSHTLPIVSKGRKR